MLRVLLLGSIAVGVAAMTLAASATETSTYQQNPIPTLTVTSDGAGDSIVITCVANQVKINGANPDAGGAAPCGTLEVIIVNGEGGADTIDLDEVASQFTSLTVIT